MSGKSCCTQNCNYLGMQCLKPQDAFSNQTNLQVKTYGVQGPISYLHCAYMYKNDFIEISCILEFAKQSVNIFQPYVCDKPGCSYASCRSDALLQHTRRHESYESGNKPKARFACEICLKSFARIQSLKEHIMRAHDNLQPFSCHMCEYKTNRKRCLLKHIENNHVCGAVLKCSTCSHTSKTKVTQCFGA